MLNTESRLIALGEFMRVPPSPNLVFHRIAYLDRLP